MNQIILVTSEWSDISSECSARMLIRVYTSSGNVTKLSNDKIITFITYSPFHYPRCDDRIKCFDVIVVSFSSIQLTKQLKPQRLLRRRHIHGYLHVFTAATVLV